MSKFAKIARKSTELSPLIGDREQIKTPELIKATPNGFHIIGADMVSFTDENGEVSEYPVILIAELPGVYYTGGTALTRIISDILAEMNGDTEEMNAELAADPLGVKLSEERTNSGKNFTKVIVID